MAKKLKVIIKAAIKEEKYFMDYYKKAAAKTEVVSAKNILMNLSLQEKSHKERLEALDTVKLEGKTLPGKLDAVMLHEDLLLTPISELKALKDVFSFAIKAEIAAQGMYQSLGRAIDDKEAKALLSALQKEEKGHELILKKELARLGI